MKIRILNFERFQSEFEIQTSFSNSLPLFEIAETVCLTSRIYADSVSKTARQLVAKRLPLSALAIRIARHS